MIVKIITKIIKIISKIFFNKKRHIKVDASIPGERYTTW